MNENSTSNIFKTNLLTTITLGPALLCPTYNWFFIALAYSVMAIFLIKSKLVRRINSQITGAKFIFGAIHLSAWVFSISVYPDPGEYPGWVLIWVFFLCALGSSLLLRQSFKRAIAGINE